MACSSGTVNRCVPFWSAARVRRTYPSLIPAYPRLILIFPGGSPKFPSFSGVRRCESRPGKWTVKKTYMAGPPTAWGRRREAGRSGTAGTPAWPPTPAGTAPRMVALARGTDILRWETLDAYVVMTGLLVGVPAGARPDEGVVALQHHAARVARDGIVGVRRGHADEEQRIPPARGRLVAPGDTGRHREGGGGVHDGPLGSLDTDVSLLGSLTGRLFGCRAPGHDMAAPRDMATPQLLALARGVAKRSYAAGACPRGSRPPCAPPHGFAGIAKYGQEEFERRILAEHGRQEAGNVMLDVTPVEHHCNSVGCPPLLFLGVDS